MHCIKKKKTTLKRLHLPTLEIQSELESESLFFFDFLLFLDDFFDDFFRLRSYSESVESPSSESSVSELLDLKTEND